MNELLIFYGLLTIVVGAALAYSVHLYNKDKHDHHSSHG